jgi:multiple sugar transport system ATP-binding protein
VVEFLGNEELIHAQSEGSEIVALLPSDKRVAVGDSVDLAVPMEKLHIFDPENEKTLAG